MAVYNLKVKHSVICGLSSKIHKEPKLESNFKIAQVAGFVHSSYPPSGQYNDPGHTPSFGSHLNASHSFGVKPTVLRSGDDILFKIPTKTKGFITLNRNKLNKIKHTIGDDAYPDLTGTFVVTIANYFGTPLSYGIFDIETDDGPTIQAYLEGNQLNGSLHPPYFDRDDYVFTGGPLKDSDILVVFNKLATPQSRNYILANNPQLSYIDKLPDGDDADDLPDVGEVIRINGSSRPIKAITRFIYTEGVRNHSNIDGHASLGLNYGYPGMGDYQYPCIDSLSAVMKWYHDLNIFHGWGLPPFKITDVNGVSRDFTPTDYTTVTNVKDYELYGEPWHYNNTLYQIVEWLKLLGRILGVNYWENLISGIEYYKQFVPHDSNEYTINRDKGKYSILDYHKLFPSISEFKPQQSLGHCAVSLTKTRSKSNTATPPTDNLNFFASAVQTAWDPPYGTRPSRGYRVFKFIKLVSGVTVDVSPDWLPIAAMTESGVQNAIASLGFDVKRVTQHFEHNPPSLSAFLVELGANLPPPPGFAITFKFELEADPPTIAEHHPIVFFTGLAPNDLDLSRIYSEYIDIYGQLNGPQLSAEDVYLSFDYADNDSDLVARFPVDVVAIRTFLLDKNTLLKRYGIKGAASCKVRKHPSTGAGSVPTAFDFSDTSTVTYYIGKTDEFSTLFSPKLPVNGDQQGYADLYDKIKTVLEGGTEILQYTFDSSSDTVILDLSEFLTYQDTTSCFIGVVKKFDSTSLDAFDADRINDISHDIFSSNIGGGMRQYPNNPFFNGAIVGFRHAKNKLVEGIEYPQFYIDFGLSKLYLTLDGPIYK